jgi:hypothetical protein
MSLLDEIPGYKAAVERENLIRSASFLPVNESLAGFEVVPMSLRHYTILCISKNPLLYGKAPSVEQLAAFLWLLNPAFSPKPCKAKKRLYKRCRVFYPPVRPLSLWRTKRVKKREQRKIAEHFFNYQAIVRAAESYVSDTLMDRPSVPSSMAGQWEPDYYSDAASLCALFAREYGWPEAHTLDMPLIRLFQYLKEIKAHSPRRRVILFNPSDRIKNDWLLSLNKKAAATN